MSTLLRYFRLCMAMELKRISLEWHYSLHACHALLYFLSYVLLLSFFSQKAAFHQLSFQETSYIEG